MRSILGALAASLLLSQTAAAQTWGPWSNEFYDVGQATAGDQSCVLLSEFEFEGRATVQLTLGLLEDQVYLGLYSHDWSALAEDATLAVGLTFLPGEEILVGVGVPDRVSYRNGLLAVFEPRMANLFASSRRVLVLTATDVEEGNFTTVADLPLDASADAVAALRRCHAHAERQRLEREREEASYRHVPRDPFAGTDGGAGGREATEIDRSQPRPSVITHPDWIARPSSSDLARFYPPRALEREIAGRVSLSCTVTESGTLTSCSITAENPPGQGFGQATLRLASRYRMRPATRDGAPIGGARVTIPVSWDVPQSAAPAVSAEPSTE